MQQDLTFILCNQQTLTMAEQTRFKLVKGSTNQEIKVIMISNPGQRQSQNPVLFLRINILLVFIV